MTSAIGWIIEQFGYLGVAVLTFAETIFPPLPSEVIIPRAGMEAQRRSLSLWGVVAAGTTGSMTGNAIWYAIAWKVGLERFKPLVDRFGRWLTTEWADIVKAEAYFKRHEKLFVFLGRMIPAVRTLICVPAGFARMQLFSYLLWSTLGNAVWTGALAFAGWKLGENFGEVRAIVSLTTTAIVLLFTGWYLWRLWRSFRR